MTKLTKLDISNNSLKEIPEDLKYLKNLVILCNGNHIKLSDYEETYEFVRLCKKI